MSAAGSPARFVPLAWENPGYGSSREHAPWTLDDFGIRALIAPSFAKILYGNCFKNGLLPNILDSGIVASLFAAVQTTPGYRLNVDLKGRTVTTPDDTASHFTLTRFRQN
ncbi:MAG: hypothetical protein KDH16_15295 [Rhodocyclaceae bacterium]|nr:hypothetical protein [Rhodocyclaceae bacterium]